MQDTLQLSFTGAIGYGEGVSKKIEKLSVRMTPETRKALREEAKKQHRTESALALLLLEKALRLKPKDNE